MWRIMCSYVLLCATLEAQIYIFFPLALRPNAGHGILILEVPRSHTTTRPRSVGLLWTSDKLVAETSTWQHTTLTTNNHPYPRVGFEPTISGDERPQTYALDRAAPGTGGSTNIISQNMSEKWGKAHTLKHSALWKFGTCTVSYRNSFCRECVWTTFSCQDCSTKDSLFDPKIFFGF